jgi:hypothetical protein
LITPYGRQELSHPWRRLWAVGGPFTGPARFNIPNPHVLPF